MATMMSLQLGSKVVLDVVITVSVCTELFIYGIYTTLFFDAIFILWKKRVPRVQNGALVFMVTAVLMYALATLHMGLSLFRFLKSYILAVDPLTRGFDLFDFERWDTIVVYGILNVMTWLGDALVIYRCYFVWNRSFWIILIPVLLLTTHIAVGLFIVSDISRPHPAGVVPLTTLPSGLYQVMYPLVVVQNILTTGLIGFKIWQQHRLSTSHGIIDHNSPLSLLRILRIIIESAMIYTLQIILYMIFFLCGSPAQFVLQNMIIPTIGIVFVLISLRVHHAKESSEMGYNSTLPHWLNNTTSVIEFSGHRSPPPFSVVRVPGEALHDPNVIPLEPVPSSSSFQEKIKVDAHGLSPRLSSKNTVASADLHS